jgi:YVTN family beta-propeller protein
MGFPLAWRVLKSPSGGYDHMTRSRLLPLVPLALLGTGLLGCPSTDGADPDGHASTGGQPPAPGPGAPPAMGNGPPPPAPAPGPEPTYATVRTTPTNGSAVVVTANDQYAVATNRTAGRVTVFRLDLGGAYPATKLVDLDVGKTSEPWAAVIGNDDDTAYVILRKDQLVVRIRDLHKSPYVDKQMARTGAEPTGIAISPTGKLLYVANWAEGTVSVIDSATMAPVRTIDLNPSLANTGYLGAVAPRPALAHPRALVVTNNGNADDADEKLYVTEFFSQARIDALPEDDSRFDVGRQGVVYALDTASYQCGVPITIAPIADTGFVDSKGGTTGCFPNQLYATTLNNGRLYVTSICQSPRGPVGPDAAAVAPGVATSNFKTQVHGAVFVIDTQTDKELPAQGLLLPREFTKLYDKLALKDDDSRRIPLIPNDIMFATGTSFAYVTAYGSDAVFRIAYKADGTLERVGADAQPFINLAPGGEVAPGKLPIGIAGANASTSLRPFAVALNENTRNLTVISFGTQTAKTAVAATDPPAPGAETDVNEGQRFFSTGLGRWSLKGQAWNSCQSCHPDGLTDNVTWFFGRGPRQTTSLDGTYDPKDPRKRRMLNWTAIRDESHDFDNNTKGNSGGVGAFVFRKGPPLVNEDRITFDGSKPGDGMTATATSQNELDGSLISMMPGGPTLPNTVLPDWDQIDGFIKAVRAPRAPTTLAAADVAKGKHLFESNGCAACHGTSQWTISNVFYTPNEANNAVAGLLRSTLYTLPPLFPAALNPPAAATGTASLRFSGANPAAFDQINCVLRDVGTFAAEGGVVPAGVLLKEVRQDMKTLAQGTTGMNIPSLLGMATGAPYFHGGNARTLEESLGETFDRHRRSFAEIFRPSPDETKELVSFLLSIDETTPPPAVPRLGFDFDLCKLTPPGIIK